jgi:hypothetical protein
MAYTYEVDVPAEVKTCVRVQCAKRFIATVKLREYCSDSCRTMVWQEQNPSRVKSASAKYQKGRRESLKKLRESLNNTIGG